MNLRRRAARHWLAVRAAGAAGCGAAGALILGALAHAEGAPLPPWVLLGALAGGASGWWMRRAPRPLAARIDPAADPQGVLRAALSVPADHPWRARLEQEAAAIRPRFQPLGELRAFALAAAVAVVAAFWAGSAPAVRPQAGGPTAPGGLAPGAARPAGTAARPGGALGRADAAGTRPPLDGREPGIPGGADGREAGGAWRRLPVQQPAGAAFTAGRDFGDAQPFVQRYLRLKSEGRN